MIVINIPKYLPIKGKSNRILLARDKIDDNQNLQINYAGSTVYPVEYSDDGSDTLAVTNATDGSGRWFPLAIGEDVNPSEIYGGTTIWPLSLKNYIMIDRYNPDNEETNKLFEYEIEEDMVLNTYKYRISDGAELKVKVNISASSTVIGTSITECTIVDLDNYITVSDSDFDDAMTATQKLIYGTQADLFTPKKTVFTIPVTGSQRTIRSGEYVSIKNGELYDPANASTVYVNVINNVPKYVAKTGLMTADSGIMSTHILSYNNNVMYKLKLNKSIDSVTTRDDTLGENTPKAWDYAMVTLTKMNDLTIGGLEMDFSDPIVYIFHKSVDDSGNVTEIGTTRLGFINQTTQILVKHSTSPNGLYDVFDEVYITGGTANKYIDVGLVDVKYLINKDKYETFLGTLA